METCHCPAMRDSPTTPTTPEFSTLTKKAGAHYGWWPSWEAKTTTTTLFYLSQKSEILPTFRHGEDFKMCSHSVLRRRAPDSSDVKWFCSLNSSDSVIFSWILWKFLFDDSWLVTVRKNSSQSVYLRWFFTLSFWNLLDFTNQNKDFITWYRKNQRKRTTTLPD